MFTDGEFAYLAGQRLGRLASVQPDGTLQNNPVGFSYHAVERMAAGVAAGWVAEPVGA